MMDIQEIREGVASVSAKRHGETKPCAVCYSIAGEILSYLAERGACFPVEGELPKCLTWRHEELETTILPNNILVEEIIIDHPTVRAMGYLGYKKVITLKEMLGADK